MSTVFQDLCDDSCQLSGFGATDEIRLVVTSEDGAGLTGKVRLTPGTSTTGLEAVTGYNGGSVSNLTADTYNELAFVGTQAEINAVLPELEYKGDTKGDSETVSISATLAGVGGRTLHYFPGTGHYYEYVDADIEWSAAKTAAEAKSFNGLTGYLVTILTKAENDFIKDKVTAENLWMGATFFPDDSTLSPRYDEDTAGAWKWVTGPTSDRIEFWSGTRPGSAVGGRFANWNLGTNEPNGSSDCAVTNFRGAGSWDDYFCTGFPTDYLVEYGGLDGESPTLEVTSTLDVYVPYTVTYDANEDQHQAGDTSGSVPDPVNVKPGSTYTVPGNPGSLARVGFTFEGWSTSNSSQTQSNDTSITVSADTTLYAQWGIPQAARLFGLTQDDDDGIEEDEDDYRSETVKDIVDRPAGSANVRGITNDGRFIYYLPNHGKAEIWRVKFGSVDDEGNDVENEAVFDAAVAVVDNPDSPGGAAALISASTGTVSRDLAYSSGCIFFRGGSSPNFADLYCVDITETNDDGAWVVSKVTLDTALPAGDLYLTGNLMDFETGEIAAVSQNRAANDDEDCPDGNWDCKILRIYDVTNEGSDVAVSHAKDVLLADAESFGASCTYAANGWPCDNHGISSDGTYVFQSNHEFGYKTWALPQGDDVVGYVVFDGDGSADLDGDNASARESGGHNADCGADDGISGGFCPINPEIDGADRSSWDKTTDRQMTNTTFFSRDHSGKRYIMGDYESPRFLLTLAATDQPASQYSQPKPTSPSSVSGSSANAAVTVSWGASTVDGGGSISYTVTSSPGGFICTTTSTSCQVSGLTNGTSYTFSVVATVGTVNSVPAVSGAVIPAVQSSGNSGSTNDDDDQTPAPAVTPPAFPGGGVARGLPTPPVGPGPAARPGVLTGPVITPGVPRGVPSGPVARFGGVPSPIETTSTGGGVDVRSGGVNLGLRPGGSGGVEQNPETNQPELRVPSGSSTRLSGGGLQPGSTVQVWLPGVLDRELGRVSVSADGGFDGEIALSSRAGENPLPIGRRVLQVTGVDENGVQTVIEMPVNIAQSPPAPEPNRQVGALPDLAPSQSIATSAGIPTPVTVTPFAQQRSVSIDGGEWVLNLVVNDRDGEVSGSNNEAFIRLTQSSTSAVSGDGFQPSTVASVWMFSEPTLLGTVTVDDSGGFSLEFLVDAQFIAAGEHTLQVQGVGSDGYIKAANLGVLVEEPVELTTASASTMLWWVVGVFLLALVMLLFVLALRRRRDV